MSATVSSVSAIPPPILVERRLMLFATISDLCMVIYDRRREVRTVPLELAEPELRCPWLT